MTDSEDHFDVFQPHTLLKHNILDAYLNAWAMKVIHWGGAGRVAWFVDAFGGAGQDREGNPGSPLIASRIAASAQGALQPQYPDARVRVVAIEQNRGRATALRSHLAPFDAVDPDLVEVLEGDLPTHIDSLAARTGRAPAIYFLDPFGVKGLDAATYPTILAGAHNEIFALFACQGARRLHGLVIADRPDVDAQIVELYVQSTLFPEFVAEDERNLRDQLAASIRALDASQGPAREILTRALGDDSWVDEIAATPGADRSQRFVQLFIRRLIADGAKYVLTLPMRSEDGNRVYTLVHASKSATAFLTMKDAVHSGLRAAILPEAVSQRIRQDLSVDVPALVADIARRHAGRSQWRFTNNVDKGRGTLRRWVLERTSIFPWQMDELKAELLRQGYVELKPNGKPVSPMLCTFPPSSH